MAKGFRGRLCKCWAAQSPLMCERIVPAQCWGSEWWKRCHVLHPRVNHALEVYSLPSESFGAWTHNFKLISSLVFIRTQKGIRQSEDTEGQHPIAFMIFGKYAISILLIWMPSYECVSAEGLARLGGVRPSQLQENLGVWELSSGTVITVLQSPREISYCMLVCSQLLLSFCYVWCWTWKQQMNKTCFLLCRSSHVWIKHASKWIVDSLIWEMGTQDE